MRMPIASLSISSNLFVLALVLVSNAYGGDVNDIETKMREIEGSDRRVKEEIRGRGIINTRGKSGERTEGPLLRRFNVVNASLFVEKINELRADAGGGDIQKLTWNENLATAAKVFAEKCQMGPVPLSLCLHTSSAQSAFDSSETDVHKLLEHYLREIEAEGKTYNIATDKCGEKPCPNYRQFVWSTTRELGCAIAKCAAIANHETLDAKHFGVCLFTPPGLRAGKKPFFAGAPCSKCKKGCESDGRLCKPGLTTLCSNTKKESFCTMARSVYLNYENIDICSRCQSLWFSAMFLECRKTCEMCD